ncbi:sensor histidine kinase [Streptomyces sp. CB02923]|uniref:sensor histidine kinase n=1 Tax=Streptomyces sp. CB02923 TaxID=1718985 RepID=UPI000AA3EC35|nr:HAMP domain-containing sensor histidine kinase [Streptomyces sp. CB02923]
MSPRPPRGGSTRTRGRERLAAAYTRLRGLRTRLIVGFLVVSALSALITATLTFRQARTAILARTQDTAVHDLRAQMESLGPDLPFPPRREDLQNLVVQLDRAGGSRNWHTYAQYEDAPVVPEPWRGDGGKAGRVDAGEAGRVDGGEAGRVDGGAPGDADSRAPGDVDGGVQGGAQGGAMSRAPGDADSGAQGGARSGAPGDTSSRALGREPGSAVTDGLRAAVRDHHAPIFQRVDRGGQPWLAIGMPVDFTDPAAGAGAPSASPPSSSPSASPSSSPRGNKPSGLVVYAEFALDDEQADISALVTAAQAGALPALALAVVPALFAARRVLLPVRRLREAAERITSGELDTRSPVTGRDELADLTVTFNDMARALEKDDAELRRMEANARRFAADVSHELRTPLAAMAAVTEVLDEDAARLDPDTADAVRLISNETTKLARMVEDLIEVSRFDAGAADLLLDEIDVAVALRKTLQLRGWQDRVETGLPEELRARLDPRRIDVVVANLVGNALRHGGAPVRVTAYETTGRLRIDVADRGPGINPEALPHVFDRFYKADAARARSSGSGLGLAIAMENVRLHGGTLSAANAPGGGAVFTVDVPLDPPTEPAPGPHPTSPGPESGSHRTSPGPDPDRHPTSPEDRP